MTTELVKIASTFSTKMKFFVQVFFNSLLE